TNNAYSSFVDKYTTDITNMTFDDLNEQEASESNFNDFNERHNEEKVFEENLTDSEEEGETSELKYLLVVNQTFETWEAVDK
ncbi:13639_t:CDS:1, partial [Gigaspora rosea]